MSNQNGALAQAIREIGNNPDTLTPLRSTERGDVLSIPVEIEHALGVWQSLRERVEETGYWPVITNSEFRETLISRVTQLNVRS
jgi:hypothetical protein